jgi:hypothetical protein
MGSVHLPALRRAEGVRLAGVVEQTEAARGWVAENGVATYESVEELLADRSGSVVSRPCRSVCAAETSSEKERHDHDRDTS